jgi:hypothetical protein
MVIIVSIVVLLLVFIEAKILKNNQFHAVILLDSCSANLVIILAAYTNRFL